MDNALKATLTLAHNIVESASVNAAAAGVSTVDLGPFLNGTADGRRQVAKAIREACEGTGFFYLTGRVKDLIITGGENVSPIEVEEVLRAHPGVEDVAVIGTPHPKWGEQVTAVIVARTGARLDGDAISSFAAARLSGFKKPRRIEFIDALPRNAAKKVMTSVLRERFGNEKRG